jgi:hypothetical protein
MIIVKLLGGLGNQMFQYALAVKMAHLNNDIIKMDLRGLFAGEDVRKEYELDIFGISQNQAEQNEYSPFYKKTKFGSVQLWNIINTIKKRKTFFDPDFVFHPEFLEYRGSNLMLRGLFQSEKYFINIRSKIIETFHFPEFEDSANITIAQQIEKVNAISLHVRRGEFANNQKYNQVIGTCDLEYYKKAISYITGKIQKPVFFIFSDDPEWVKQNIVMDSPCYYITQNTGKQSYRDMQLMSLCKHNIIANSTFSWWGAWLNQNPDKIVIAPQIWFSGWDYNTKDLIPISWIKI